jgi:ribosomal protein S6
MTEDAGAAAEATAVEEKPKRPKGQGTRPKRDRVPLTETPLLPKLDPEIEKLSRLYELCLLFDPAEATRTWDKLEAWIKELITKKYGQHVLRVDKWADSRKLAYEIKGLKRGTFMVVWFRSQPRAIVDLDRDLRLDERAVRHIIVHHEQEPPTVGKTAEDYDQNARKEDDGPRFRR